MNKITIRLGGYQGPNSVHTRGAVRFGEALEREVGSQVAFAVWQGAHGEVGARKMRSAWIPLALEAGK